MNTESEDNPDVQAAGDAAANDSSENLVLVYDAPDLEAAQVVHATLEAAGIPALLANPDLGPAEGLLPHLGLGWSHGVFVTPSHAEAARAILNAPAMTEEELVAAEEADPMTLEEAEARVRDA